MSNSSQLKQFWIVKSVDDLKALLLAGRKIPVINLLHTNTVALAALAVKAAYPPNPPSPVYEQLGELVEALADGYVLPKEKKKKKNRIDV
jgi:hypothetical protein